MSKPGAPGIPRQSPAPAAAEPAEEPAEDPESEPDHRAAPERGPAGAAGTSPGPGAPRHRALDALRALDAELLRLTRAAHADAEIRGAVRAALDAVRTATAHPDGTTTLVVATAAWTRLRDTAAN